MSLTPSHAPTPEKLHRRKRRPAQEIDAYIEVFPSAVQARLKKIRALIRQVAPEATETIKYRIPTFVQQENLVHFAAFAGHIGLYPTAAAIRKFSRELAAYKSAKGSVQFPHDRPIPYGLIKRIVVSRVREVTAKHPVRRRKA